MWRIPLMSAWEATASLGHLWGFMQTEFWLQVDNKSKFIPSQKIKKRVKKKKKKKIRILQAKAFGNISFYDRCRPEHSAREVIKMKLALHVSLCRREPRENKLRERIPVPHDIFLIYLKCARVLRRLFLSVLSVTRVVYFHANVTCFAAKHLKFNSHYSN